MPKEIRSPNDERSAGVRSAVSEFGLRYSFGFRDSSFGFGSYGSVESPLDLTTLHWDHERSRRGDAAADLRIGISAAASQWQLQGSWKASFRISNAWRPCNF